MAGLLTGLGGFNNTSLPWPLKSSRDFAETPAHYQVWLHVEGTGQMRTGMTRKPLLLFNFFEKIRKHLEASGQTFGSEGGTRTPTRGL